MLTTNEVAQVMDTIMSSPGMNESVRIDMRISRKTVLLLHQVIEHGIAQKGAEQGLGLLANASEETITELQGLGADCLQKAGLIEMSDKLTKLSQAEKK